MTDAGQNMQARLLKMKGCSLEEMQQVIFDGQRTLGLTDSDVDFLIRWTTQLRCMNQI